MNRITYGLDVAKRVFQMHWVEPDTGKVCNRRFSRAQLVEFLSQSAPAQVALEACGSGHFWARKLKALGHEAVLLHAKFIRPFVQNNKTDATDARAIGTAVQKPGMHTVAVKTEDQQAVLGLHRMRSQLLKFRTAQINQLRGLLYEYGITIKGGRRAGLADIRARSAELEGLVPTFLWEAVNEQLARLKTLDQEMRSIEQRIKRWQQQNEGARAIADIPGVGLLTSTALVATMGDPQTFRSGREFAAFLGLVPRQRGTGGHIQLGHISKRGDMYLRGLLIHGARSVLVNVREQSAWVEGLARRRPHNVAVVALANKIARTAWAMLSHGQMYQRDHVSARPPGAGDHPI